MARAVAFLQSGVGLLKLLVQTSTKKWSQPQAATALLYAV